MRIFGDSSARAPGAFRPDVAGGQGSGSPVSDAARRGARIGRSARALSVVAATVLALAMPAQAATWSAPQNRQVIERGSPQSSCPAVIVPDPPRSVPTDDALWDIVENWGAQPADVQFAAMYRFAELLKLCPGTWVTIEPEKVVGMQRLGNQVSVKVQSLFISDEQPGGEQLLTLRLPPQTLRSIGQRAIAELFGRIPSFVDENIRSLRKTVLAELNLGPEYDITLMRNPANDEYVLDGFVYGFLRRQAEFASVPFRIELATGKVVSGDNAPAPRDAVERAEAHYLGYLTANNLDPSDVKAVWFNLRASAIELMPSRENDDALPGKVPPAVDQPYEGFPWRLHWRQ